MGCENVELAFFPCSYNFFE